MFEDVLHSQTEETQQIYRTIVQRALDLGYRVRKDRTKTPSYSLYSPKFRQTILRVTDDGKKVSLRLKFYGAKGYSRRLDQALKRTIEEYDFRYTGCYGCGRCVGEPLGYQIAYEDGRREFRCGFELIEILGLDPELGKEIEGVVEAQTRYWQSQAAARG